MRDTGTGVTKVCLSHIKEPTHFVGFHRSNKYFWYKKIQGWTGRNQLKNNGCLTQKSYFPPETWNKYIKLLKEA